MYVITKRFFGQKSTWLAVLIFFSMPMISTLASWAYNDLALAFYQLASLYAVMRWRLGDWEIERLASDDLQTPSPTKIQNPKSKIQNHHWLFLSGIFAGLAMGLKYTSFVTPTLITILIIWTTLRSALRSTNSQLLTTDYRFTNHLPSSPSLSPPSSSPPPGTSRIGPLPVIRSTPFSTASLAGNFGANFGQPGMPPPEQASAFDLAPCWPYPGCSP